MIFNVEEAEEGGYYAVAVDHAIFTQGETLEEIRAMVVDAVECHFDEHEMPTRIHLRFTREETIVV